MQVHEALRDISTLSGSLVTIEGLFIMEKDTGYIVTSKTATKVRSVSVNVDVPNLKQILFARVPALGGSQFSYCDEARITGVLVSRPEGEFPASLIDVERLEIYKYDEPFLAIP